MSFLMDDADIAGDMSHAIRVLMMTMTRRSISPC